MNRFALRCLPALLLAVPLSAQIATVSEYFIFKGTVYEQTSAAAPTILANPQPHAPGPYYLDVGVTGSNWVSAPSFKKPDGTAFTLTATDANRWDYKAGYSNLSDLDTNFPNLPGPTASNAYKVTIPGYNAGAENSLFLPGNPYANTTPPLSIGSVGSLGPGLSWSNGTLVVDPRFATTLNVSAFTQYDTSHTGLEYRQWLAIVPPSGSYFGQLSNSAFNDASFTSYNFDFVNHPLAGGSLYRAVLEYDVFTTYNDVAGTKAEVIYSNQTQFFITAIPEPSTYALLAGVAMLAGAAWRKRARRVLART